MHADLHHHKNANRRRATCVAAAFATLMTAAALLIAPAATASADTIDCSYGGPGLRDWIDAGGAPGTTCAGGGGTGGHTTPGSPTGTYSNTGQQPAAKMSGCGAGPSIPDDFYNHGPILSYFRTERFADGSSMQIRDFYRSGKMVGPSSVFVNKGGAPGDVYFMDSTLRSPDGRSGILFTYFYDCTRSGGTGSWDPSYLTPESSPVDFVPLAPLAPPGSSTPPAGAPDILTHAALTPIPGSTDRFFLRVDVTNNLGHTSDADIDLDLSEFSLQTIATMPSDASCPFAMTNLERCTFPNVAPGTSETMTFVVKANASTAATATLPIRTSFAGHTQINSRSVPFELSRRGTVTTEKTPTT